MDPQKVLVQYGATEVGPAVRMDSDGIRPLVSRKRGQHRAPASKRDHAAVVPRQAGPASRSTRPTGSRCKRARRQAGPRITLHPTNGITLQAGPALTGASITLHPTNGITLNFGPYTSLKLRKCCHVREVYQLFLSGAGHA